MKKLIFGLGNPGNKYEQTRHNLGVNVVRAWKLQITDEMKAQVNTVAPTLPMNASGTVLNDALKFIDVEPQQILVAHDDIELPLGEVELVFGGSAKGHNGVRSIYDALDTQNIHRLKLGVGRPPEGMEVKDFVLSRFTIDEQPKLKGIQEKTNQLIDDFVNSNSKDY